MIRPLRATHRAVFFALAIVLPFLFVGGLLSRPRAPSPSATSSGLLPERDAVVSEKTVLANSAEFRVRIWRDSRQIQLVPKSPLVAPDVLVYWTEQSTQASLPAQAFLLGAFRPPYKYVPPQADGKGFVVLYSLARREVLAVLPLESQP